MAIKEWLDKQGEQRKVNFDNIKKIKGIIKGSKRKNWSGKIDEILYI